MSADAPVEPPRTNGVAPHAASAKPDLSARPVADAASTLALNASVETAAEAGAENVVLRDVRFVWRHTAATEVFLAGSFDNWKGRTPMRAEAGGAEFSATLQLPVGQYSFKFVVDGEWCYDILEPVEEDVSGNVNNVMIVA